MMTSPLWKDFYYEDGSSRHEMVLSACPEYFEYPPVEQARKARIDRNAQCPCGSGKKYKKCCYLERKGE